jgi:hypothetical protein
MKLTIKHILLTGAGTLAISGALVLTQGSMASAYERHDDHDDQPHKIYMPKRKTPHKKSYTYEIPKHHNAPKPKHQVIEQQHSPRKHQPMHKAKHHTPVHRAKQSQVHKTKQYSVHKSKHQAMHKAHVSRSNQVRYQLDVTLREHAALGVAALKAKHLKQPDAAALLQAVEQNNLAVARAVGQAYPGTHDQFLHLWRAHITYYGEYLMAAEQGSAADKQQAKQKLAAFTWQVSNLLDHHSHHLNKVMLQQQLAMHGNQVTAIIDNLVGGNYNQVYMLAHQAYVHMGATAQVLAQGAARH